MECVAVEQMPCWIGEGRAGAMTQLHSLSERFAKRIFRSDMDSAHVYIHTDTCILPYKNTLAEQLHL